MEYIIDAALRIYSGFIIVVILIQCGRDIEKGDGVLFAIFIFFMFLPFFGRVFNFW